MSSGPTCVAARTPGLGGIFGPRCGEPAAWVRPEGSPLCEHHYEEEVAAILSGETILNVLADRHGVSAEAIVKRYRRIQ